MFNGVERFLRGYVRHERCDAFRLEMNDVFYHTHSYGVLKCGREQSVARTKQSRAN